MKPINEKDQNLIDSIPKDIDDILEVGAGCCRLSYLLCGMGYNVTSTDIYTDGQISKYDEQKFKFYEADIFNMGTFERKYNVVICSQVLEHLPNYEQAFKNLLDLTKHTLIMSVPWKKSFLDPTHVNFWDDKESKGFTDIHVFEMMSYPWNVTIDKIYTKQKDRQTNSMNYLIKVTK